MRSIRRHLASLGLTVAISHLVIQLLVTAALCCQAPAAANRVSAPDCCPAGSHPGQICPMHAQRAKAKAAADAAQCHAAPLVDFHDVFVALNVGGVVPTMVQVEAPAGSESLHARAGLPSIYLLTPPPGPPPRV